MFLHTLLNYVSPVNRLKFFDLALFCYGICCKSKPLKTENKSIFVSLLKIMNLLIKSKSHY